MVRLIPAVSLIALSSALGLSCGDEPRQSDDDDGTGGASAGGGGAVADDACDTYIDCVSVTSPAALSDVLAAYGMDGSCWQELPADQCKQACAEGTAMLHDAFPDEPACGLGQGGMGGSCDPAVNGWPASQLPSDYVGTGYEIGDQIPVFANGADQHGNIDVSLGQFYGNMLLLAFHAPWSAPSQQAAVTAQALMEQINQQYGFWIIDILIEGYQAGQVAQLSDGQQWANSYGLSYPVLIGQSAHDLGTTWNVTMLPTYAIIDPELRIREIMVGYSPDAGYLSSAVDLAHGAFVAENPGWTPPCP